MSAQLIKAAQLRREKDFEATIEYDRTLDAQLNEVRSAYKLDRRKSEEYKSILQKNIKTMQDVIAKIDEHLNKKYAFFTKNKKAREAIEDEAISASRLK